MSQEKEKISKSIIAILEALGEDIDRPGLKSTPERVADMYAYLFSGMTTDPKQQFSTMIQENPGGLVVVKDLPFNSLCEHHLLPFTGQATIAYVPNKLIAGVGAIAKAVEILSKRAQIQERLTSEIACVLEDILEPQGIGIVIEAEHLCMTIRGSRSIGSKVITSYFNGILKDHSTYKEEFLSLIRKEKINE